MRGGISSLSQHCMTSTWQIIQTLTGASYVFLNDWRNKHKTRLLSASAGSSWSSFSFCILIKLGRNYQLADQVRVNALWVMEFWLRRWLSLDESGQNRCLELWGLWNEGEFPILKFETWKSDNLLKELFAGKSSITYICAFQTEWMMPGTQGPLRAFFSRQAR